MAEPPSAAIKKDRTVLILTILLVVMIAAAVVGIIVGTVMISSYQRKNLPPPPVAVLTPVPAQPGVMSKFATDSAVLQTKEKLQKLLLNINTADYFEAEINPPSVETNISLIEN